MNWQKSEEKAFKWFQAHIDPDAMLIGGEDSTQADIYSHTLEAYIEIKDITCGARCGQFTESTIKDNPFAQAIYNGDYSPEICHQFIQYHYSKKNVTHFIVVDGDEISFHSLKDFLSNYIFQVQNPYQKRSGTRKVPKRDIAPLLKLNEDFVLGEDGYVYCRNTDLWGEYVSLETSFDYFISKKNNGELRKRSATQNMTWHLLVKKSV